jgi:hypothetical protein
MPASVECVVHEQCTHGEQDKSYKDFYATILDEMPARLNESLNVIHTKRSS